MLGFSHGELVGKPIWEISPFRDIVSNAEGGQVPLRAGRVQRAEVGQLSGSWTGRSFPLADSAFTDFLKISVTDSGIGISPEGLEPVFKPFSQIDSDLARKFEGTGLRLAMVKRLAELHGGAVAVESAVGEGSLLHGFAAAPGAGGSGSHAGQSGARRPYRGAGGSAHRAGGRRRLQIR